MCSQLFSFDSIHSIFQYSGLHRELLLRAKEAQEWVAIRSFYGVYSNIIKSELRRIIDHEKISFVVLPRLSLRRVSNLQWHPIDFWIDALSAINDFRGSPEKIIIFSQTPWPARRRAYMKSEQRFKESYASSQYNSSFEKSICKGSPLKVDQKRDFSLLFVDDVLTSGGSLLRELEFLKENSDKLVRLIAQTNADFTPTKKSKFRSHVLTLFRTPVSQ